MATHFSVLGQMADHIPQVTRQLMFGTDWYMLAVNPGTSDFASTYRRLFRTKFGDDQAADFMGRNALRFLGFASASDPNGKRLRRRYADLGAARPAWLGPPETEAER
jgi:hypothetical protein